MEFFGWVLALLVAAFLLVMTILVSVGIYAIVKTEFELKKIKKERRAKNHELDD